MQLAQETVALFTGARGSGKSTEAKKYLSRVSRVAMFDVKGEYPFPQRMNVQEFAARAAKGEFRTGIFRASILSRFGPLKDCDDIPDPDALADDALLFLSTCWRVANLCAAVEEVSLTGCTASFCPKPLSALVNVGRDTRGISLVLIAQRPSMIPTTVRSQANYWSAFRQAYAADADAVSLTFRAPDADVLRLKPHQFFRWEPDGSAPQLCGPA